MIEKITKAFPLALAAFAAVALVFTPPRDASRAEPPSPASSSQETTAQEDVMPLVKEILDGHAMSETALSHCVYDEELYHGEDLTGAGTASPAHALARLCGERKMNPIVAFWSLTEDGFYKKTPDTDKKLAVPAVRAPETAMHTYPYTDEGVRKFLTELLTLSAGLEDGLPLDERVLGKDGAVAQVYQEGQECRYAYYVCYSPEAAHFLCFYLRGDKIITDAEFQLLSLRYADGDQKALKKADQLSDRQAAALMTAAELLLTGESRAAEGRVPMNYTLGDYAASIERFRILGSGDTGTLTNYRIRK